MTDTLNISRNPADKRDAYIDFLRALGLILLIGVHVAAPDWYVSVRAFDVPLMVFVSAMCYNSLRGGVITYVIKRFKRIYIPVAVFLTLFFAAEIALYLLVGKPKISLSVVGGSYLLLNWPSIGYVWIMRVFLMIALIMPLLHRCLKGVPFAWLCLIFFGVIICQHYVVLMVESIENNIVRFVFDETLLYVIGYSAIAVVGFRVKEFTRKQLFLFTIVCLIAVVIFVASNDWLFNTQAYKYPPQSLYIIYGMFACLALMCLKPVLKRYVDFKFFNYLSENSMWIYLWHIIPVYAITPWMNVPNMWLVRYCAVFAAALLLTVSYKKIH